MLLCWPLRPTGWLRLVSNVRFGFHCHCWMGTKKNSVKYVQVKAVMDGLLEPEHASWLKD